MKLFISFACLLAIVATAVADDDVQIISNTQDVRPDGFAYAYELSNSIKAQAEGVLKDPETLVVNGQYSYISPEGEQISLQYTADENGYHPQGDHLPTPPPIPAAIQKALEYLAAHPQKEE